MIRSFLKRYEYFDKAWHEAPGLYSMFNDPGLWAEHIDEHRAKELMKIIDDCESQTNK